ncbi:MULTISPECIES: HAD family hydrolase [unclassified Clostridioides]|uniref:HAD family hydrolase n=1 Tax=unclassified Clostridioides TaxID=2635829 RepID=UPI001D11B6F2|nr:HAD family hydrolase [Clostridioides sp. ZZV14-6154]MCC0668215.1 HAD family hydrolase [Clostridioides sp. ZZV14-6153]MCC0718094.1 HAD family hydrolase [Clostridioides sp. ZZV14-6105]MCC0727024.1 HAD family hydrolase [Clostridioides sp. ZZV14-6045]MCC0729915.1 HAD family hydrolase [Clostridioides sp. ZZV14-6048]MCC0734797.1 HAD family hydrolase [Clostridioides sp. ZZV14-6009]MCC0738197.1 HAD family hydrolase [Clostridioides sp. ZZV14-5902]WLD26475.1 Phosphoglycolate phosphatase [Clostridio
MINLIFDVDDTLYNQLTPFYIAYDKVFSSIKNVSVKDLYISSRKYSDEVFHLTESGEMPIEKMHVYRIMKAFEELGNAITEKDAQNFQDEYIYQQSQITLIPEMEQVLNFAKEKNINMGIITNGPSSHQRMKLKQLNIEKWVDEENIFISSEVGFSKPDINIFRLAEKFMNLDKANTYYVGDSYKNDVVGSKKAGWKSIWMNHRKHRVEELVYKPDFIILDYQEIPLLYKKLFKDI